MRNDSGARMAHVLGTVLLLVTFGCAASKPITRDFGARYEQGREIPPDAYAAALRAAIAEAAGDFRLAKREYDKAGKLFPDDPELTTRSAAASCALKPDAMDLEDATRDHPTYAPAWFALAQCYERMDQTARAKAARTKAAELAPGFAGLAVDAFTDATFLRDHAASYFAAAVQAGRADDGPLEVWAYARAAELSPALRVDVARVASELLLRGRIIDAKYLSTRLVDLGMRRDGGSRIAPSIGRLAVDEAIQRDDVSTAMARANAARIPLGEVALRAHVIGRFVASRSLAALVLATDPASGDAQLATLLEHEDIKLSSQAPTLELSRFGKLVLASAILPWGAETAARVLGERRAEVSDVEDVLARQLLVRLAMADALHPNQAMLDIFVEARVRAGRDVPEGLLHSPILEQARRVVRGEKTDFRRSEVAQDPLAAFAWCKGHANDSPVRPNSPTSPTSPTSLTRPTAAAFHSRDALVRAACK